MSQQIDERRRWIFLGGSVLAVSGVLALVTTTSGYPRYRENDQGGYCFACHGEFDGPVSPQGTVFPSNSKHEMHRANSEMNTDCGLCHTSIGDNPFMNSSAGTNDTPGLGCAGCHSRDYDPDPDVIELIGAGLRLHHFNNNVTCSNAECHTTPDPDPLPENIWPPYYGSIDTDAADSCNSGPAFMENWSVNDSQGLDNDGDQVYDTTDDDCGGCPWDCDGSGDGDIGINDFLAVLGQWGAKGTSCDIGLGAPGVGVNEFLAILGLWGSCP